MTTLTLRAAFAALVVLAAGCGSSGRSAPPPVLPAGAVPYLPSDHRSLDADTLAHDAQAPALASRLGDWGLRAAAERTFQGQSRRLQFVVSRTLVFADDRGARAFVAFVRAHPDAYLGAGSKV